MDQLDALDSKFEYIAPQGMQAIALAFKGSVAAMAKAASATKDDK